MITMSELDRLMEQIRSKYAVETTPLTIGGKTLQILQLADFENYIEQFVEKNEGMQIMDLPFWAKIWEGSLILAYLLGKQPVIPGQRVLEIGAGLGIVGLYAALFGHDVTITDVNEDALLFTRANALLNGLDDVKIQKLNWSDPGEFEPYDRIIGSEVIYDRRSYPLLVEFLLKALAPNGIIFLSKNADLKAPAFFTELTRYFEYKETTQKMHSEEGDEEICLYAIRRKQGIEPVQA